MATPLQPQILAFLTPIFVFLLLFVGIYALLQKFKILGGTKGFDALAALCVSLLSLMLPETASVISLFTPWVLMLGLLVFIIFAFFLFFGLKSEDLIEHVVKSSAFVTFFVAFIIIFFLVALSQVYGPFLLTNAEPGFWNATKRALFHPRLIGAILLLVLAAFSVSFVTQSVVGGKK